MYLTVGPPPHPPCISTLAPSPHPPCIATPAPPPHPPCIFICLYVSYQYMYIYYAICSYIIKIYVHNLH